MRFLALSVLSAAALAAQPACTVVTGPVYQLGPVSPVTFVNGGVIDVAVSYTPPAGPTQSTTRITPASGMFTVCLPPAAYAVTYRIRQAPPLVATANYSRTWTVPSGGPYTVQAIEGTTPVTPLTIIGLTQIGQSGATNGQTPVWNTVSGAWLPGTFTGTGLPAGSTNDLQTSLGGGNFGGTGGALQWNPAFPGLSLTLTNPTQGNDANDRRAVRFNCTTTSISSNPNFSDENCLEVSETVTNGQAIYGNGTNAKKTFIPLSIGATYTGSGQKFLMSENLTCYSMSDCNAETRRIEFAGGPIAGDESQGIQSVSFIQQQTTLTKTTVTGSPVRTSCNTTLTQNVTASKDAQTVTVASLTGCSVNDWIVVGQEAPTPTPNEIAVLITAVGGGAVTGVFNGNYSSGATVTPATVLTVAGTFAFGQDRVLVDLTTAPYTTGTVTDTGAATFTGSGTTWTTGMVGGTALVPGCVSLTNDDYSGSPFNGSGLSGTLKSWYQISGTVTATSLHPYATSVAGNGAYFGNGVGNGAYTIRPCAKVLRILNNTTVILETNSFAWAGSDSVELAITPYPDVTAYQYQTNVWTPGGIRRAFLGVRNAGARTWNTGLSFDDAMPTGGGADTVPWNIGVYFSRTNFGMVVGEAQSGEAYVATATNATTNSAVPCYAFEGVGFGGHFPGRGLCGDSSNADMFIGTTGFGVLGIHSSGAVYITKSSLQIQTILTVSTLPTCNGAVSGTFASVSDATAPTYLGPLTGSGSVHAPVYCNGSAWVSH